MKCGFRRCGETPIDFYIEISTAKNSYHKENTKINLYARCELHKNNFYIDSTKMWKTTKITKDQYRNYILLQNELRI